MKKRVRIYKPTNQWRAQMGGYQATEAAAPQTQLNDEDLINATVKMLAQGSQPQEVLNSLVENGIDQQKATEAVKYSVDYIKNIQDSEYEDVNADANAQQQAALEEAAAERQAVEAQEAEARKARMQELYGLTEDNTTQDYSDDEQAMMDMMRYGGLPNKRTFIKNSVNLAKKQMGGQEEQMPQSNRADNTDTGDRRAKLQKFVGSLQNHANEALMKEDAEAAYNQMQMMQQQMPFMPMAQEGGEQAAAELNPRQQRQMARQQKQMGRQMNRMIGNIPVGLYNNRAGGLPTNIGVINMPAIGTAGLQSLMSGAAGLQNYLPSSGSTLGGPKLANIDVRKTGLFGRPKQYSITFAQDVVTNPTTAENATKQEIKNVEEEAKDVEEKVTTAAEDVKKADEATKAAEEAETKSASGTSFNLDEEVRKTLSGAYGSGAARKAALGDNYAKVQAEINKRYAGNKSKVTPKAATETTPAAESETTPAPKVKTTPKKSASASASYFPKVETQTGMRWLEDNYNNSGVKSVSDVLNSKNSSAANKSFKVDPELEQLVYDKNLEFLSGDEEQQFDMWNKLTSTPDLKKNPVLLRMAQLWDEELKKKYGTDKTIELSAHYAGKQAREDVAGQIFDFGYSIANPAYGIANLAGNYLGYQQGGFTQEGSGLYKFVYGGNDMYEPPIPGKITDDPYMQYGGLKRYADGDEVKPVSGIGTEADPKVLPEVTVTAPAPQPWALNPDTGKVWTIDEWNAKTSGTGTGTGTGTNTGTGTGTGTNTATTSGTGTGTTATDNTTTTTGNNTGYNYGYGYNPGVGPIYPPLFGGGRGKGNFLQNLLSLTPYGANPLVSYAGTWTQQKGLPIDPATGQPYTGDFANPQIAKIDVRKTGLFGRPKKYSIDYMVDDVPGTSSFLSPEDYPGGVNPGATGTVPLPGTTATETTSDGLAIDPETGEPLPVGREIKNLKLKSFMSKIPGVRQLINWGDAPEMTPEEEFRFKTKSEMERNMAAEERGDIVAPLPEDETTSATTTPGVETVDEQQLTPEELAWKKQALLMQENAAAEERGDIEAPLPPGERTTRTEDERSFDVERRIEPMVEGIPQGTSEEIRNQLAQQRYLSGSSFADYQAGPTQNIDAAVAEQFGVPQSMVDQFAYQAPDNTDGSVFDLSTQRGFDKQQYLNESLGREPIDVSQRPTTGSLTPGGIEQINTDYTTPNLIQSPQTQADYDRVTAELIKQGIPVNQQNIMQQVAKEQAGVMVRKQQAIEAEQRRIAAQKAAAQKAAAAAKASTSSSAGASSSGSGTKVTASKVSSEVNTPKTATSTFKNLSYDEKQNYLKELIDLRDNSTDKAYRRKVQDLYNDLDKIYIKEWEARQEENSEEAKYKQIKDQYNFMASGLEIDDYLKLQKSGKLPTYKERDYYRDLAKRTSRQYGGMSNTPYNLYRANNGVTTPVITDPRFGSYVDMMKSMADEEAGLMEAPPIPGQTPRETNASGMKPVEFGDVEGMRQNAIASDKFFGTNYVEDYGLDKPGRKKVTVNYKNKNMWTIDPLVGVETALAGAKGLTRFLNTRDERKREKELAQSLTSDSVYGSRSARDKGTYDPNSGLFRPNEMGANVVSKYGGTPFKEGGTTYMSAAQVKKFLEEGGELEFV